MIVRQIEGHNQGLKPMIVPWLFILIALGGIFGCQSNCKILEPEICYIPQQRQIESLPSAFATLSPFELSQDWGKELRIGDAFAREFDLYRAITSYKRALVLISRGFVERRMEIQYKILQSYSLGQKFKDVGETFESSDLTSLPPHFPAAGDLLIILFEAYTETNQEAKAEKVKCLIDKYNPEVALNLELSLALREGDFPSLFTLEDRSPYAEDLHKFLGSYQENKRSVYKAKFLNAVLPGAGYYYVGQKKTALTSLALNALFIAAAYQFFARGDTAAGLITASFEAGWYLGGINGAGLAAKEWNEAVYQNSARDMMVKNRLFPSLMLETSF